MIVPLPFSLLLLAFVSSAFAEHPALVTARRALDERLPEIALAQLTIATKSADFPIAERDAAWMLTAEAQLRSGKPAEALATLEKLDGKDVALLRAHALGASGRWAEALSIYDELAGVHGVPMSATIGKAEALQILGRTPEAVAVLEKLVASGKAPVTARLRHTALLTELGRKNEAAELLVNIQPSTPADGKWRDYVNARLLLADGQWKAALDALDAILADPEGVSPNLLAAMALAATEARLNLKNFGSEAAARALETFLWNQPENPAIEMIFRRLDQINAKERSPREMELHNMAKKDARISFPRRAALAQFYVCRMQSREKSRQHLIFRVKASDDLAPTSPENFFAWFPNHNLTTYVHEMQADIARLLGEFDEALEFLEAAQRAAPAQDKERAAFIEMRMGLISFQKGDPSLAVTYFRLAAEHSARMQKSAAFNAALSELAQKNLAGFRTRFEEFSANYAGDSLAGELVLEAGFTEAREGKGAALATLRTFLTEYPAHPRRGEAHLAIAELLLSKDDVVPAREALSAAKSEEGSDATGGQAERNEYAAIFAADAHKPRDEATVEKVVGLARQFIAGHPRSALLADVRMKLGQIHFNKGEFGDARTQFEALAREQPAGDHAEAALFLAGQCASNLMSDVEAERALSLFAQVVERKGSLKYYALFQQGYIQHQMAKDATAIYQTILDAQPPAPAELRYAAFCAKGDNLVKLAKGAPEKLGGALAAYTQLANLPDAGPEWHNQAVYRQGRVLMELGQAQEALVIYDRLLESAATGAKETFWLYKAGFDAATILEEQGSWRSAFVIYEKMGNIPGPRAAEARAKVKELRLKKFIWD